ncbi:unnamed protein product [Brassica oleracea]
MELLLWWYPSSASIRLQLFTSSSEKCNSAAYIHYH